MLRKLLFVLTLDVVILVAAVGIYANEYVGLSLLIPLTVVALVVSDVMYLRSKDVPLAQSITTERLQLFIALVAGISAISGVFRFVHLYRIGTLPLVAITAVILPALTCVVFFREARKAKMRQQQQ
jgi:hypothetical protein